MADETLRRRDLNANRVRLFGTEAVRRIAFLCECGDENCRESVITTAGDFDALVGRGEVLLHDRHAGSPAGES